MKSSFKQCSGAFFVLQLSIGESTSFSSIGSTWNYKDVSNPMMSRFTFKFYL